MQLRPVCEALRLCSRPGLPAIQARRIVTASTRIQSPPPSYQILEKCPEPGCSCAAMPEMPEGLPIDATSKMSMPYYDRHVVLAGSESAQAWPSKLELDEGSLVKKLKDTLGPKGECYRPDFSVAITASTLPDASNPAGDGTYAYMFPDFVRLRIDTSSRRQDDFKSFARSIIGDNLIEAAAIDSIKSPVILICGHGQRDQRCGIMGPVLQAEFERHFAREPLAAAPLVGQVSHIGGHKFAGNVVVYIPPGFQRDGKRNDLGGCGVWYGRVEPRHVPGIVRETLNEGRVIKELLRGVHDFGRATAGAR